MIYFGCKRFHIVAHGSFSHLHPGPSTTLCNCVQPFTTHGFGNNSEHQITEYICGMNISSPESLKGLCGN